MIYLVMNVMKAVVILSVLLAPYALIHVDAQEVVKVDIAEGSQKVDNNKFYVPARITVPVGSTVVWTNFDDAAHTVTDGTPESKWGRIFDSGIIRLDDVYEFTFNEPGKYPYLCALHPWMSGTVTVPGKGQEIPLELSVKLDKAMYQTDDNVAIEGSVSMLVEGMNLMIEILNPNGESVVSESVPVSDDGMFSYSFKLVGEQFIPGSYTVRVNYSDANAEGVFEVEKPGDIGEGDGTVGSAKVSVTAKQVKDLLLIRFRNADSSTAGVYSVTIETSNSVIEAFKGPRNWDNVDVTADEATSVSDEPLNPGGKAVFKLKVANEDFVINWIVYDSNNNALDQGESKPIRR